MTKQHLIGFVLAFAVLVSAVFGHRAYQLYKVVVAVEQLSQVIAQDQKTGHNYTVADVVTALASERIQQQIQAQKSGGTTPQGK